MTCCVADVAGAIRCTATMLTRGARAASCTATVCVRFIAILVAIRASGWGTLPHSAITRLALAVTVGKTPFVGSTAWAIGPTTINIGFIAIHQTIPTLAYAGLAVGASTVTVYVAGGVVTARGTRPTTIQCCFTAIDHTVCAGCRHACIVGADTAFTVMVDCA